MGFRALFLAPCGATEKDSALYHIREADMV